MYPNSPTSAKINIQKYLESKEKYGEIKLNTGNDINKSISYPNKKEINYSINIEDLLIFEKKYENIITAIYIGNNEIIHSKCLEFGIYFYNLSLFEKLERLIRAENDRNNLKISINHILMSVIICHDYSYEMEVLKNGISFLHDILKLNHINLIINYAYILSNINIESKSNIWSHQIIKIVENYYHILENKSILMNRKTFDAIMNYNVGIITENIRALLKYFKTKRNEYLISIFKKINEKANEEIDLLLKDNILRIEKDKDEGTALTSAFFKDNKYLQTVSTPYIKVKNTKPFSLILDLDETLMHFKIKPEENNNNMVMKIRPFINSFIEKVRKYYELIIFTEDTQDYGDELINGLEKKNIYFEHRFYRQHTVKIDNDFIKDLDRIGSPLETMIIVDDMPQNYRLQKENGIHIKAFWGYDVNDNALEELGKILVNIAKEGGDLRIGIEKYKYNILNKVTFNRTNYSS